MAELNTFDKIEARKARMTMDILMVNATPEAKAQSDILEKDQNITLRRRLVDQTNVKDVKDIRTLALNVNVLDRTITCAEHIGEKIDTFKLKNYKEDEVTDAVNAMYADPKGQALGFVERFRNQCIAINADNRPFDDAFDLEALGQPTEMRLITPSLLSKNGKKQHIEKGLYEHSFLSAEDVKEMLNATPEERAYYEERNLPLVAYVAQDEPTVETQGHTGLFPHYGEYQRMNKFIGIKGKDLYAILDQNQEAIERGDDVWTFNATVSREEVTKEFAEWFYNPILSDIGKTPVETPFNIKKHNENTLDARSGESVKFERIKEIETDYVPE